ncbi:MAG: serine/threonine protein kinase [Planctomycetia bacterium]|nr:serine/threonine protein kinase [Planctomycetia bacterium]
MTHSTPLPAQTGKDMDLSGREVGDYRLLRRLGQGGMADVYLAEQKSLRRQVAFKVLKSSLAQNANYIRRFQREAQAAAALVHANIVQIYEVGCVNGLHFIAQEYVPGQNLREFISRQGTPDARLAVRVVRQVASALHRAAERGIIHRDIKPENILITRNAEVKVADFGLARLTREGDGLNLTQDDKTMGTPLYMSPEQVEGKPLDHRSDLYSLGVTAYHMLTGSPPFQGETALSVAVQHLRKNADRLENVRGDLPAGLCRVVHRLIEKSPVNRYDSARELLKDLRSVQVEMGDRDLGEDVAEEEKPLWEAVETQTQQRLQATHRLDTLMKTEAVEIYAPRPLPWRWLAAGLLAAALIGVIIAWKVRAPSLLDGVAIGAPNVERRESAREQFLYASLYRTERHWQSVSDYYPDAVAEVRMADKELAMLYLQKEEYDRALPRCQRLANVEGAERALKGFGLAGQVVVFAKKGQYDEALAKLIDLQRLDGSMQEVRFDQRIRDMLHAAGVKSIQAMKDTSDLSDWLNRRLRGRG